jgi:hypothetical protein
VGTLQQWELPPIPEHIAAGDDAAFYTFVAEWRRRTLEGRETQNDRQLIEGWLGV